MESIAFPPSRPSNPIRKVTAGLKGLGAAVITTPGGVWMGRLLVTVEEDHRGPLTNLAEVTTEEGAAGADSVIVSAGGYIYLPLVLRDFPEGR